jgi:hypothetical protein
VMGGAVSPSSHGVSSTRPPPTSPGGGRMTAPWGSVSTRPRGTAGATTAATGTHSAERIRPATPPARRPSSASPVPWPAAWPPPPPPSPSSPPAWEEPLLRRRHQEPLRGRAGGGAPARGGPNPVPAAGEGGTAVAAMGVVKAAHAGKGGAIISASRDAGSGTAWGAISNTDSVSSPRLAAAATSSCSPVTGSEGGGAGRRRRTVAWGGGGPSVCGVGRGCRGDLREDSTPNSEWDFRSTHHGLGRGLR